MTEAPPGPAPRRFPIHPLDLLVLVLAVAAAMLAYSYLFRTSPVPAAGDWLLGAEIEAEFTADRPWKEAFPASGSRVRVEDALVVEVLERSVGDAPPSPGAGRVRLRLRVAGRSEQPPDARLMLQRKLRRGSTILISDRESEVAAEVLAIRLAGDAR